MKKAAKKTPARARAAIVHSPHVDNGEGGEDDSDSPPSPPSPARRPRVKNTSLAPVNTTVVPTPVTPRRRAPKNSAPPPPRKRVKSSGVEDVVSVASEASEDEQYQPSDDGTGTEAEHEPITVTVEQQIERFHPSWDAFDAALQKYQDETFQLFKYVFATYVNLY
jgi:hypothetical protein